MPYRRRTNYRRKPRRGRTYRRRFKKSNRYNKRGQKIYLFKRFADMGTITANNLIFSGYGYEFDLQNVPNYTEFTALYDQFKINGIKVTFVPQMTENISLGSVNNAAANARMFTCLDFNDSSAPSSVDEIREYQSCKWTSVLRPHKRYFRPRIVDSSSIYNPGRPWLSCANGSSESHFGLKVGIEPMNSTTTANMTFRVEAKFYLSFKTVK